MQAFASKFQTEVSRLQDLASNFLKFSREGPPFFTAFGHATPLLMLVRWACY